jgi:hypothetical protein
MIWVKAVVSRERGRVIARLPLTQKDEGAMSLDGISQNNGGAWASGSAQALGS